MKQMPKLLVVVFMVVLMVSAVWAQDEATPIDFGDTITDTLDEDTPRDTYTFTGTAGTEVTITLVSEEMDPYLLLLDSVLASTDSAYPVIPSFSFIVLRVEINSLQVLGGDSMPTFLSISSL